MRKIIYHNIKSESKITFMIVPLYQYYAYQKDGIRHFYNTRNDIKQGWIIKGVKCYVWNSCVYSGLKWSNANEAQYYQHQTIPFFQYHCDQSKTYGGYRFMYSHSANQKDDWEKDKEAFYAYYYGELPQEQQNIIKVNRYHKVQQDGWRFCYLIQGQKPEQQWILDQYEYFYAVKSINKK